RRSPSSLVGPQNAPNPSSSLPVPIPGARSFRTSTTSTASTPSRTARTGSSPLLSPSLAFRALPPSGAKPGRGRGRALCSRLVGKGVDATKTHNTPLFCSPRPLPPPPLPPRTGPRGGDHPDHPGARGQGGARRGGRGGGAGFCLELPAGNILPVDERVRLAADRSGRVRHGRARPRRGQGVRGGEAADRGRQRNAVRPHVRAPGHFPRERLSLLAGRPAARVPGRQVREQERRTRRYLRSPKTGAVVATAAESPDSSQEPRNRQGGRRRHARGHGEVWLLGRAASGVVAAVRVAGPGGVSVAKLNELVRRKKK
ncbi:MAG: hypothetical protein BJ554DRAFT_6829, partial [Olpidium bornovanus]